MVPNRATHHKCNNTITIMVRELMLMNIKDLKFLEHHQIMTSERYSLHQSKIE